MLVLSVVQHLWSLPEPPNRRHNSSHLRQHRSRFSDLISGPHRNCVASGWVRPKAIARFGRAFSRISEFARHHLDAYRTCAVPTRAIMSVTVGLPDAIGLDFFCDSHHLVNALWREAPFTRLPPDAPAELKHYVEEIRDPRRSYSVHRASRRHDFQELVARYVKPCCCTQAWFLTLTYPRSGS